MTRQARISSLGRVTTGREESGTWESSVRQTILLSRCCSAHFVSAAVDLQETPRRPLAKWQRVWTLPNAPLIGQPRRYLERVGKPCEEACRLDEEFSIDDAVEAVHRRETTREVQGNAKGTSAGTWGADVDAIMAEGWKRLFRQAFIEVVLVFVVAWQMK